MKPYRKIGLFHIRWKEGLGHKECPYMVRWVFVAFGFSIRIHHWIRSDDKRYFHDHPFHFISFILKGRYFNVTPEGRFEKKAISCWFSHALKKHYVEVPEGGAWTLLLCGRPFRKWGFWIPKKNNTFQFLRPLRYFARYGTPPCDVQ